MVYGKYVRVIWREGICVYIYIYIERERYRDIYTHT